MWGRDAAAVAASTYEEFQDPVAYAPWVWVLGLGLLLAVAAWYLGLWWWWRRASRRPAEAAAPVLSDAEVASLRVRYLARIDVAHQEYSDGSRDLRSLHLELNRILREYGATRSGSGVRAMTVRDLRRVPGARPLAAALARQSEPAFARRSDAEAAASAARAREVVSTW